MSRTSWRSLLADLERADTAAGRAALGAYRLEGLRLVERALRAGATLRAVAVGAAELGSAEPRWRDLARRLADAGHRPVAVPDDARSRLTGGRGEGAVAALAALPDDAGVAPLVESRGLALVGVDVDDPGNVGALVRTALASGCALYVSAGRGDPFHPRAVRISRGAVLRQSIARMETGPSALRTLRACGARVLGAVAERDAAPLDTADLRSRPLAVVVGNEARGLDAATLAGLDDRVTIPMADTVDSFAVNAAAAIALWEARRSR